MSPLRQGLVKLLHTLPAIVMVVFIEITICFITAAMVMLQLMPSLGRQHSSVVLGLAILTAVVTQAWIVFNHKVRAYIKSRSTE